MILGYSQKFPWGGKTDFESKIKDGIKIHTVRRGERWRKGLSIQHSVNVRTKDYRCFKEGICEEAEKIVMWFEEGYLNIRIGGLEMTLIDKFEFAKNDGFDDYNDFVSWFWLSTNKGKEQFVGQVVHYTDKRYSI